MRGVAELPGRLLGGCRLEGRIRPLSSAVLKAIACKSSQLEESPDPFFVIWLSFQRRRKGELSFIPLSVEISIPWFFFFHKQYDVLFSLTYWHIHTVLFYSPPTHLLFCPPAVGKEKSSRIPSWCPFPQHLFRAFVNKALVEGPGLMAIKCPFCGFVLSLFCGPSPLNPEDITRGSHREY